MNKNQKIKIIFFQIKQRRANQIFFKKQKEAVTTIKHIKLKIRKNMILIKMINILI